VNPERNLMKTKKPAPKKKLVPAPKKAVKGLKSTPVSAPTAPTAIVALDKASTATLNQARTVVGQAQLLKVDDAQGAGTASDMLVQLKRWEKEVEEKRAFVVKPLKEHVKRLDALFKPTLDQLEEAERLVKGKLLGFQEKERAKAEAERAKLLEQAEEAQAEGDQDAAVELATQAMEATSIQKTVQAPSEMGSVQTKMRWTFEVTDLGAVPPEYMSLDEGKVRAAIRSGVREVSGLRIFQQAELAVSAA
ncbi:MAG: hypothetical protein KGI71_05700, partial [Patescibacteria group bacterium]|nr:hypothetical protein [Patescibacteria group bacterium]